MSTSTLHSRPAPLAFSLDIKEFEALLWPSRRPSIESSWNGHVSFAHWIVSKIKPIVTVELGTHTGVSFTAFCNAVQKTNFPGKCFAVDTWQGDMHSGFYDEEIYASLNKFVETNFPGIATLMRCYFDKALEYFENGTVDLLHIDGLHTYDAVKHDFETWLPKMSQRGVILFHDTDVKNVDFGVWQLWEELSNKYPSYKFEHSAGLGLLAVGEILPPAIKALCSQHSMAENENIRKIFSLASNNAQRIGAEDILINAESLIKNISNGRRNIALNKPTFQSSILNQYDGIFKGAVSGIKTGGIGFHTEIELNPWWMVDLTSKQTIDEVIIYNRLDPSCRSRARSIEVLTSIDGCNWGTIYLHDGVGFGGIDGEPLRIKCDNISARFIRIKLNDFQFLHLDEVEVYGIEK